MKCHHNILVYFVIISFSVIVNAEIYKNILARNKRQYDDQWSWGYLEIPPPSEDTRRVSDLETTTQANPEDPCTQAAPPQPDFRAPERRISETKCFEYMWYIKRREEQERIDKECKDYLKSQGKGKSSAPFVIGGTNAEPGEFPHMAAIGWEGATGSWIFKCGGTLISDKFVLTAGHCIKSGPDTNIVDLVPKLVRMGDRQIINWEKGHIAVDRDIEKIIPHPQYKAPKQYFDIALMELSSTVIFNYAIQPACLWPYFDTTPIGYQAAVTGWGVVDTANRTTSPILQKATVDMVDSGICDSLLRSRCNRKWCGIEDTQICAGKLAGGVDACQGDSGGPLQMKINLPTRSGSMYYVVGVTSFGFGCAIPDIPGVYTRVSTFVDWIESIVWP